MRVVLSLAYRSGRCLRSSGFASRLSATPAKPGAEVEGDARNHRPGAQTQAGPALAYTDIRPPNAEVRIEDMPFPYDGDRRERGYWYLMRAFAIHSDAMKNGKHIPRCSRSGRCG